MKPPDTKTWWTNRRRLAYLAMAGLFALVLAVALMPPEQITAASPVLTAVGWMFGLVLGAYVGAATWEDTMKLKGMMK